VQENAEHRHRDPSEPAIGLHYLHDAVVSQKDDAAKPLSGSALVCMGAQAASGNGMAAAS
jgi:hypothetical protein